MPSRPTTILYLTLKKQEVILSESVSTLSSFDQEAVYYFNEFFPTLQGEGSFSGTPMALLRLQGCPVQCAWCDTKQSWYQHPDNEIDIEACLSKKSSSPQWARATAQQLLTAAHQMEFPLKNLLITGGEPACVDLRPLSQKFEEDGWKLFLETSGTEEILASREMWVTVSPKFNMRGRKTVRLDALARANEIKFVIARPADLQILDAQLQQASIGAQTIISLQPLAQNPNILPFCIEIVMKRNWRLSLQTHKFLNLR